MMNEGLDSGTHRWLSRPLHCYVNIVEKKNVGERAADAARCACRDEDLVFLKARCSTKRSDCALY